MRFKNIFILFMTLTLCSGCELFVLHQIKDIELKTAIEKFKLSSSIRDIGIGPDDSIYLIGKEKKEDGSLVYRFDPENNNWISLNHYAVRLSVDPEGYPWTINTGGIITKWNGSSWVTVPGKASDIGIGSDGSVFVVGTENYANGSYLYKLMDNKWVRFGKVFCSRLDVNADGEPWIVNKCGYVFWYNSKKMTEKDEDKWTSLANIAYDIGINRSKNDVFITGCSSITDTVQILFRWRGYDKPQLWSTLNDSLVCMEIDCDNQGNPYVIAENGRLYKFFNSNWTLLPDIN